MTAPDYFIKARHVRFDWKDTPIQWIPGDPSSTHIINILNLLKGGCIYQSGRESAFGVAEERVASSLRVDLDRESGELRLGIETELPESGAQERPLYIVANRSGWIFSAGIFRPLQDVLPPPLWPGPPSLSIFPTSIARAGVPHFVKRELPMLARFMPVETELGEELFDFEPAAPRFALRIKGSPASLASRRNREGVRGLCWCAQKEPLSTT